MRSAAQRRAAPAADTPTAQRFRPTRGLRAAVRPPEIQEALLQTARLEQLRESLAVVAATVARTHGRLAWFLAGAVGALQPVLRWRVPPADGGRSFATVVARPAEHRADDCCGSSAEALGRW
ncbi:hypothetical protein Kpho02_33020 [Kitasatospora phosalacinea]|uniref:Uncharacterized protein n=1 Tax=Kitasatospora phosalacinea TaxID=2065 RepID=A0A9W6Q9S9_9ACTN|nr:hypothetical protein Kpho02_33020 [Kitasatospora phosalacinea]